MNTNRPSAVDAATTLENREIRQIRESGFCSSVRAFGVLHGSVSGRMKLEENKRFEIPFSSGGFSLTTSR